ncbi:MAG: phytoene desaturase [Betaproteobacteria bacterium]|nr:phytoene desaturase [Betaproteobacteria bacterium]
MQSAEPRAGARLSQALPVRIVGGGVGGLAAAIQLAAAGYPVQILEQHETIGGKMRALEVDGTQVPCGPTVFTMRWVFDALFEAAGQSLEQLIRLQSLAVLARHAWSEDERLDLFADPKASLEAIAAFSSPQQAQGFARFCAEAKHIHDHLIDPFIRAQRPDLWSMMHRLGARGLLALTGLGPFKSLWSRLAHHFPDTRLQQLFGRYATYCGTSPWSAPATLVLIAHVEMQGVWAIQGGMPALAQALAQCASALGVEIRCNAAVRRLHVQNDQLHALELANGEQLPTRQMIYNGDVRALAQALLGDAVAQHFRAAAGAPMSLSALTWCLKAQASGFDLSHHNVFFQPDYRSEFDDIFQSQRLPRQPTVYLCAPERLHEPGQAGPEPMLLLVNAAAQRSAKQRSAASAPITEQEIDSCQKRMLQMLKQRGLSLSFSPQQCRITAPQDFSSRFPGSGGALYGPAANGWMATFAREQARSRLKGLYLAGGSVHPGPGVPMAAMSGVLAAEALMADHGLSRRFHPAATSGGTWMRSATISDTGSP